MKRQKNKFLNFLFALIPGASQMYMGFMQRGASLMLAAAAVSFLAYQTDAALLVLLAVVEAYSFFDGINRNGASPEDFAALNDDYFFADFTGSRELARVFTGSRSGYYCGVAVVVLGVWLLLRNISRIVSHLFVLTDTLFAILENFWYYLPRIALSALIIYCGLRLIKRKKQEICSAKTACDAVPDAEGREAENSEN